MIRIPCCMSHSQLQSAMIPTPPYLNVSIYVGRYLWLFSESAQTVIGFHRRPPSTSNSFYSVFFSYSIATFLSCLCRYITLLSIFKHFYLLPIHINYHKQILSRMVSEPWIQEAGCPKYRSTSST